MSEERVYKKNKLGHVGYLDGDYFHGVGYRSSVWKGSELTDASSEEIKKYKQDVIDRKERIKSMRKKEEQLLSICDLSRDDFVRFRGVRREGDILYVETRENGVGMRSADAIKNENYISSRSDDYDSTYEYYQFSIPTQ